MLLEEPFGSRCNSQKFDKYRLRVTSFISAQSPASAKELFTDREQNQSLQGHQWVSSLTFYIWGGNHSKFKDRQKVKPASSHQELGSCEQQNKTLKAWTVFWLFEVKGILLFGPTKRPAFIHAVNPKVHPPLYLFHQIKPAQESVTLQRWLVRSWDGC